MMLFPLLSLELKTKAPGAKTFLQVNIFIVSIWLEAFFFNSTYSLMSVNAAGSPVTEGTGYQLPYSRSAINQMWILKNSKELLDNLKSPNFNLITNIKSFDFSTLHATIPHYKLRSRLATTRYYRELLPLLK